MKICAIGDYDSICGFSALGMDIFEATEKEAVEKYIKDLAAREYAVILITENAAFEASEEIDKFKNEKVPAIIPIPSVTGTYGMGIEALRTAVERAVGSAEMIFGENA